eukprot:TRINITY_DN5257_c0_g1_i2.p1 TRINITY_DN5257_c0_g1~~TRINITY_DN5257_c0_g1_i2.p1  ORF type:complete len:925 (-),score=197.09 TRINITY_DN5257_c0_g1_i2:447-3221(-)
MSSQGPHTGIRRRHALQLFKTDMCKFYQAGRCDKGESCSYAHLSDEVRSKPDLTRTSMCRKFAKEGVCTNASCRFAHTESDLRATHGFFKMKMCVFAQSGRCKHGRNCRFAHSADELRPAKPAEQAAFPAVPAVASKKESRVDSLEGANGSYMFSMALPEREMHHATKTPQSEEPATATGGSSSGQSSSGKNSSLANRPSGQSNNSSANRPEAPASGGAVRRQAASGSTWEAARARAWNERNERNESDSADGSSLTSANSSASCMPRSEHTSTGFTPATSDSSSGAGGSKEQGSATGGQHRRAAASSNDAGTDANILTLLINNVPSHLTQGALLSMFEDLTAQMRGNFNFFYCPWDQESRHNLGYSIISFTDASHASEFQQKWSNKELCRGLRGHKPLKIMKAALQGLEANIKYFREHEIGGHCMDLRFRPLYRDDSANLVPLILDPNPQVVTRDALLGMSTEQSESQKAAVRWAEVPVEGDAERKPPQGLGMATADDQPNSRGGKFRQHQQMESEQSESLPVEPHRRERRQKRQSDFSAEPSQWTPHVPSRQSQLVRMQLHQLSARTGNATVLQPREQQRQPWEQKQQQPQHSGQQQQQWMPDQFQCWTGGVEAASNQQMSLQQQHQQLLQMVQLNEQQQQQLAQQGAVQQRGRSERQPEHWDSKGWQQGAEPQPDAAAQNQARQQQHQQQQQPLAQPMQQGRRKQRPERWSLKGWQQGTELQPEATAQNQVLNAPMAKVPGPEIRSLRDLQLLQAQQELQLLQLQQPPRHMLQSCREIPGPETLQPHPKVLLQGNPHSLGPVRGQPSEAQQKQQQQQQQPTWPPAGSVAVGGVMGGNLCLPVAPPGSHVMAPNITFPGADLSSSSNAFDPGQNGMTSGGYAHMVPYMMLPVEAFGVTSETGGAPTPAITMGWMGGNEEVYTD